MEITLSLSFNTHKRISPPALPHELGLPAEHEANQVRGGHLAFGLEVKVYFNNSAVMMTKGI